MQVAPSLVGLLADATGTVGTAFTSGAVMSVAALLALMALCRLTPRPRQVASDARPLR